MIGRLLGYLEVMGLNVIDDILRKAANVLKTFPVSGGEAVNEGDITDEDLNRRVKAFRKRQNARTRGEFMNLMTSDHGHIVIEAGSGSRDAKDAHGYRRDGAVRGRNPRRPLPRGAGRRRDLSRSSATTATATSRASSSSVPRSAASTARNHAHCDRRDDREHGQPRAGRRVAAAPRRRALPDPDPLRELRELSLVVATSASASATRCGSVIIRSWPVSISQRRPAARALPSGRDRGSAASRYRRCGIAGSPTAPPRS